jgi:hypothetical protein
MRKLSFTGAGKGFTLVSLHVLWGDKPDAA